MAHSISQLLDTLTSTISALRDLLLSPAPPARVRARGKAKPSRATAAPRTRPGETAARRKAKTPNPRLALQGKYMAAVRGLSTANKAKVKKVLATQGVEAAIALAQSKKA